MKIMTNAEDLKTEIMNNGPIIVGMSIYDTFYSYASGVYEVDSSAEYEGGHAVKMYGWGTDSGGLYWLCANQWGTDWGDSGHFMIRAGHAGIDSIGLACEPEL